MKHIIFIFCLVLLGAGDAEPNTDSKADPNAKPNTDFDTAHDKALWSPKRCSFLFVLYRWWFALTPQMIMHIPCHWFIMPMAFKCDGAANIKLETISGTEKEKTYFAIRRTTDKRFKGFKCSFTKYKQ